LVWYTRTKRKISPKLVTGEWIGAYGLTEPSAVQMPFLGRQALSFLTMEILDLNGEKSSSQMVAGGQVYIVFAQVEGDKFSAFIVERDTPGFGIGAEEKKMGMKGSSTTSLTFTDAKVPVGKPVI
jgi:alkylation response protein AidB-like acyl-CoA dehydrogenase